MKFKKSENNITKANRITKSKQQRVNENNPKIVKKGKLLGKQTESLEKKQQITIKRSSGREEKFDTERMSQTVGRSGVPFLMARDVAKKVSRKIEHEVGDQHTKKNGDQHELKEKTVSGGTIRKLVDAELRDRNRSDIAASYSGQTTEKTLEEQNLKDKQPNIDPVAANRNRVLHDTSKRGGGIMT
jgi:hypothetical protein